MPNNTINNAANTPINQNTGTVPNVLGAIDDWLQPMTFTRITKSVSAFQEVETETDVDFRGSIQPLTDRQLQLKPEGQRAWSWFLLFAEPQLQLEVDEVVVYLGVRTRVMALKNWTLYGYMEYHLCQDWEQT